MAWLTITPTSGAGNESFDITAELNDDLDRNCVVTVSGNGVEAKTFMVTQEGMRETFDGSDEEILMSEGDTFNVLKDKYANEE